MKPYFIYVIGLLVFGVLCPQNPLMGQKMNYSHPNHDFGFTASPDWEQYLFRDNGQIFQVVNPNKNMQIFLSFIPDCDNPVKQLKMLSGKIGLICRDKPHDTIINSRKAFLLQGNCVQRRKPYRRMLLGIPGSNGLYVMEICCPEECYSSHRDEIYSLLGTVYAGV